VRLTEAELNNQILSLFRRVRQPDNIRDMFLELRDRIATLTVQLQAADTDRVQQAQLAAKAFELSQGLEQKWVDANYAEKRQLLDLVCLNFRLDGTNLVPQMNKPFDLLAEGLPCPHQVGATGFEPATS